MTVSAWTEVQLAVGGALKLARGDASGLGFFDTSIDRRIDICCAFSDLRNFRRSRMFGRSRALSIARDFMFKISTFDTPEERRLVVEGTLIRPWVTELRKTWCEAGDSLDGRRMVIDLTNATIIDSEGEAAILELMQEGAKFSCSGVLTKHVLKQLAHKCHRRLHGVLEHRPQKNER